MRNVFEHLQTTSHLLKYSIGIVYWPTRFVYRAFLLHSS